jgi:hypothetical protein
MSLLLKPELPLEDGSAGRAANKKEEKEEGTIA